MSEQFAEAAEMFTAAAHDARDALNRAGLPCPSSIAFAAELARNAAQTAAAQEKAGPLSFAWFKASRPAKAMFRKMDLLEYLDAATSWHALRTLVVDFNGCDEGRFVALARQCDGVASSGERVLLHAILYVTDFAWLADELGGKRVWQDMDRAGGDWRRAVAACIGAEA